jgi:hypothetical protein
MKIRALIFAGAGALLAIGLLKDFAAAGIVVGYATSHEPWSLFEWLTERSSDAVAFAAVAAMVVALRGVWGGEGGVPMMTVMRRWGNCA